MAIESKLRAKGKYFNKKLKAKEVLRLYQAGERNFQGVILRGQSFKGQDLSGADFSEADIRSANFSGAKLVGANFTGAKCGLQKRWINFLVILCWISIFVSEFSLIFIVLLIFFSFSPDLFVKILGRLSLILLSVFLIFIFRNGTRVIFAAIAAVMITIVISIGFLVVGGIVYSSTIRGEPAVGFAMALMVIIGSLSVVVPGGLLAGALSGTVLVAVAGEVIAFCTGIAAAVIITGFVFVSVSLELVSAEITESKLIEPVAIVLALAITTLYGFIVWRIISGDKRDIWLRPLSIFLAGIGGTNFYEASLIEANFTRAILKSTDFRKANLTHVCWHRAKYIDRVRPGDTYLNNNQLQQWLIGKGTEKNFDGQNLSYVNLQGANLINASFVGADLSGANLSESTLTGACIKDWNIDSQTILHKVTCDYIYFEKGQQERRPSDYKSQFKSGDFANLVQKALNTVDLIFSEGIDWQGFLDSFKKLQVEDGNGELVIQAIERKTNGAFVVRVEVPPDADKASIEESFWQKYNPTLEAKDREIKLLSQQTEFYSQQVEVIRKDNTRLLGIVETMAEKETIKVQQNFNAPVSGVAGNVEGNQNIFSSNSIADASTEILNLLTTLQNNGLTQEQAEQKVAQDLATTAEKDLTALGKLVHWGKSLSNQAAEISVDEVVRRVIKLALNLAGVPMP